MILKRIYRTCKSYLQVSRHDNTNFLIFSAKKICKLKLFSDDEESRWKYSVKDSPVPLSILAVSQFTLYARTDKGSKPDFHLSMPGEAALPMFNKFVELLREELKGCPEGSIVQTGAFGKYMNVEIINDGPVTIILESKNIIK